MADPFVNKYFDVLQNIEVALVQTYKTHKEMTDWDTRDALKALIRTYKAERNGRAAPTLKLNVFAQAAYDNAKMMCEFRLGRREVKLLTQDGKPPQNLPAPLTLDEIIACLQYILNSVELWHKEGGQRGYYNFVRQFLK
ncbi:MAG: hypothetical protein N2559_01855 [Anaerolineae bacterium]|nr:hypothetical protein [Anaerolineae bacterium]